MMYRDYKNFDQDVFSQELCTSLSSETVLDYTSFEENFLGVLNKHAPLKKKVLRANHVPYVTKALRKAIMKSSYSEKLYFKKKTTESSKKYKKHKNFCSRLYKKERKKYFDTLNVNKVTDNKAFWKNIQPLFSENRKFANKITLKNSEKNTLSDDTLVSEELNDFFENATKTLNINENSYIVGSSSSITDPVDKAISTYKNHSSILLIKQKLENVDHFSFKEVSISEIEKDLRELNSNKATTFGNIPTNILKQSSKSCFH